MGDETGTRLGDRMLVSPEGDPVALAKAYFIGEESGSQSNALLDSDKQSGLFKSQGALVPVYDPGLLVLIFENSSALRPNVDAYVTNIDSFGHTYEPVLDVTSEDALEKVRDALRIERAHGAISGASSEEPTDEETSARLELLKTEMRAERAMLENFFENCTQDMPFSGPEGLRGLTRQDIEVLGSGYWEVLRNELGEVAQFNHLPGKAIRLMPLEPEVVQVQADKRLSLLSSQQITVRKRFRRHVQISETSDRVLFYKEFGDPRAVDTNTGKVFPDEAAALAAFKDLHGQTFRPATEILPFKISSPRSPYGVPRWIGTLLAVLGTRQSEEVNFLYFENRSVPPMALIVSGGRLGADAVKRLEDHITTQVRGKRNFHKMMIIEAETSGDPNTGRMRIVLQPLTEAQQKDGLFQAFEEKNADKVGQAFRLPRLLRGDVRDFNRSTAEASVDFAEIQVFGPIRQQFDWMMNKQILPVLGARYHRFKSNAPTVRDPEALSAMIKDLVTANVLTPGEGRELAADVFNRAFDKVKAAWSDQPVGVTLAGRQDGTGAAGGMSIPGAGPSQEAVGVDQTKADLMRKASILTRVHKAFLEAERKEMEADAEHIKVPADLFYSWFENTENSKG